MTGSRELLIKILYQIVGNYRDLLEIASEEEEAIALGDVSKVQDLLYSRDVLVESLKKIENHRIEATNSLMIEMNVDYSQVETIDDLAKVFDGDDNKFSDKIRSLGVTLNHLVGKLKAANSRNQKLIEISLGHINKMRQNIYDALNGKNETYSSEGKKSNRSSGEHLLNTEL